MKAVIPVLSEESINVLADQIKDRITGLRLALLLNIPNTTVVQSVLNMSENVGFRYATEEEVTLLMRYLLNYWCQIRSSAKPKDKINDMEKALKECGLDPLADIVNEKFAASTGLTADLFQS